MLTRELIKRFLLIVRSFFCEKAKSSLEVQRKSRRTLGKFIQYEYSNFANMKKSRLLVLVIW